MNGQYRMAASRPRDPDGGLVACQQLLQWLEGQVEQAKQDGATAFAAGDLVRAGRLLERATRLRSLQEHAREIERELQALAPAAHADPASAVAEQGDAPVGVRESPQSVPSSTSPPKAVTAPTPLPSAKSGIGGPLRSAVSPGVRAIRRRTPTGERTAQEAYRIPILRVLVEMGGSGEVGSVLDRVFDLVKDILSQHDLEPVPSLQEERWRNAAKWCRNDLRREGLLRGDSPHGIWEISPEGREWLARSLASRDQMR